MKVAGMVVLIMGFGALAGGDLIVGAPLIFIGAVVTSIGERHARVN